MQIVIDFDGTCVTHEFPNIGRDVGAIPVLKELIAEGHDLILFTMRSDTEKGKYLTEAAKWFRHHDIPLYGIQVNPTQHTWTTSPKAYGQIIIDDAALGCPLVYCGDDRPYVDWDKVRIELAERGLLPRKAMPKTREPKTVLSEWQACPICGGRGFVSPSLPSTNTFEQCSVCQGSKIIIKPVIHEYSGNNNPQQ